MIFSYFKHYFSIAVQRVLFDFGFKKLLNKRVAFSPYYRHRLFLATFKGTLMQI